MADPNQAIVPYVCQAAAECEAFCSPETAALNLLDAAIRQAPLDQDLITGQAVFSCSGFRGIGETAYCGMRGVVRLRRELEASSLAAGSLLVPTSLAGDFLL
jgi:hypothetical protein